MGAQQQGADATANRWMTIPRTLCFVFNGGDVLLMKRGAHKRVFPNQYNALGGHIERDEDPHTSARREIREESGLAVRDLRLCGVHNIDAGGQNGILLLVFSAWSDSRDLPDHTEEGTLHWVPVAQAHQLDLVEDLPMILPRIAAMSPDDPPYFAHLSYSADDLPILRFADET